MKAEIVESSVSDTFKILAGFAAATPLLPIFGELSDEKKIMAARLEYSLNIAGKEYPAKSDFLIAPTKPSDLEATVAIRDQAKGLTLFIFRGTVDQLLSHHSDLITNPPTRNNYKDISRYGVGLTCGDCPTQLLALARSPWGEKIAIDLWAQNLTAGTKESSWLLNALQKIDSQSSNISKFIRG